MRKFYPFLLIAVLLSFHCSFGQSHFGAKQLIADSVPAETFELAYDMNQDGATDLILFERDTSEANTNPDKGSHVIRYNDGSNHFAPPTLLKEDDTEWTRLSPLDVDQDGDIDLILYQSDLKKLILLKNDSPQGFTWAHNVIEDINDVPKYYIADLNHDQFPDLVFNDNKSVEEDSTFVDWYLNDSTGNFSKQERLLDEYEYLGIDDLFVADINEDGWNDILVPLETRLLYYRNLQDSTFARDTLFTLGFYKGGDFVSMSHLTHQDVDHDGFRDLSFIVPFYDGGRFRSDLLVYRNEGDSAYTAWQALEGGEGTFTNFYIADVDGDDDPDIAATSQDELGVGQAVSVVLFKNNGNVDFAPADTLYHYQSLYALQDFEGDGQIDIITKGAYGLLAAPLNQPQNTLYEFMPSFALDYRVNTSLLLTSDINGDSLPDAVLGSVGKITAFLNADSSRRFTDWFVMDQYHGFPNTLAAGDLNGDHQDEILAAIYNQESSKGKFSLYQNLGNKQVAEQLLDSGTYDSNAVFVADVDQDGDQDVITYYEKEGIFYQIFFNNGNFAFTAGDPVDGKSFGKIDKLIDFNQDSLVDVVAWFNGSFNILLNNGTGDFADPGLQVLEMQGSDIGYLNTHWADIDGDGYLDAVSAGVYYHNNEGMGLTAQFTPSNVSNISSSIPLDVDQDGDLDIVANNTLGSGIIWFENTDGLGNFAESKELIHETAEVFSRSDLDQDGYEDLITLSSRELAWYKNLRVPVADTTLSLSLLGQSAYPLQEVVIPLRVKRFHDLIQLQLSLQWNPDTLKFIGVDGFALHSLDSSDFILNAPDSSTLSLDWADTVGNSLADDAALFLLHFQVLKDTGSWTTISFQGKPVALNTTGDTVALSETGTKVTILKNYAPTGIRLSNDSIQENQPVKTKVGYLITEDADTADKHTYTLVSGAGDDDNALFKIRGDSLFAQVSFDYEKQSQYSIRVQTDDGKAGVFADSLLIHVINIEDSPNHVPVNLALTNNQVDENAPSNTIIGILSAEDPDGDPLIFSLVDSAGATQNNMFAIADRQLLTSGSLDYETQSTFTVRVQADDGRGGLFIKTFTITVNDVEDDPNNPPTNIVLDQQNIMEGQPAGTLLGLFTADDPDEKDTLSFSLISGLGDEGNDAFTIQGDSLLTATVFDYEQVTGYSIRVQVDDGNGGILAKVFTILVLDQEENEAPTDISLSRLDIDENKPVGTVVGKFTAVDANVKDTLTYQLVAGEGSEDNAAFSVAGDKLLSAAEFDYETKKSYNIRVQVSDGKGGVLEKAFVILVNNKNENNPPVAQYPLADQVATVDKVFTYTVPDSIFFDADEGDELTYSATLTDGSALPQWLAFDAKNKTFVGTPTENFVDTVNIAVKARDKHGDTAIAEFMLTVERVTGIEDERTRQVTVYPVPADGNFVMIELGRILAQEYRYTIVSMEGRKIQQGKVTFKNNHTPAIDISTIPAGTYLLELSGGAPGAAQPERETIRKSIIIR